MESDLDAMSDEELIDAHGLPGAMDELLRRFSDLGAKVATLEAEAVVMRELCEASDTITADEELSRHYHFKNKLKAVIFEMRRDAYRAMEGEKDAK